jgi:hypothetical protein
VACTGVASSHDTDHADRSRRGSGIQIVGLPRPGHEQFALENDFLKEKLPKRRLVIRDFIRLEWRNLYYSSDKPDSSSLRLRNRVEMSYPMTRRRLTDDGATYVTGDAEWSGRRRTRTSDTPASSAFVSASVTGTAGGGGWRPFSSGTGRGIRPPTNSRRLITPSMYGCAVSGEGAGYGPPF